LPILKATNITRNQVLAERMKLANNFFSRLRGLLLTPSLPAGHALLIEPCQSIHSLGMSYAIDVIFLDKQKMVVELLHTFAPWRVSAIYRRAHSCLELPPGTIAKSGTTLGDQLVFQGLREP
jgi:uncharacterized membrane protein (UPF0127 family)